MDIDKASMLAAYENRSDPKAYKELIGYFYEMADFFTNQSKVSPYYKDDYIQEAVTRACNKLHLFNPRHINSAGQISEVFSYFYRLISFHVKYCIRDTSLKRQRRPATCSYDVISAMVGDPTEENGYDFGDFGNIAQNTFDIADPNYENKDRFVSIDGGVYPYSEVMEAMRELDSVKKLLNKDVNLVCEFKHSLTHIFFEKHRTNLIEKNALKQKAAKMQPVKNVGSAVHTVNEVEKLVSSPVKTVSKKDHFNSSKESRDWTDKAQGNLNWEAIMQEGIAFWQAKVDQISAEIAAAKATFDKLQADDIVLRKHYEELVTLESEGRKK
jgi:hypothetical protein